MSHFHIYIHYKQKGKEELDYPNDVNFNRAEVNEIVRKYESGEDFLIGGFTIRPDPYHIKKFEIWETIDRLDTPVDWNEMWRIGRLVTKEFTTSIPGAHRPEELNDAREKVHGRYENNKRFDLFICHASEDKEEIIRPLAEALVDEGFSVWYDEITFKIGDRLLRKIDEGLAESRYGLVVLSPNFFAKEWPQKELDGLTAKESEGKSVILPVWHNVDAEYVKKRSPILASIYAVSTEKGIDNIVEEVLRVVEPRATQRSVKVSTKLGLSKLINSLKQNDRESIEKIVREMQFNDLKQMFSNVLDGVALLDLPDSSENTGVFNFILAAILERNREEGEELFEILLNWYFETTTPKCKNMMLKMFAHFTKATHLKKVVSERKMTGSFVAEFAVSHSFEIAGVNSEILQNIKSSLSEHDCRRIVDSALSNDQILFSWRAKDYLMKILSCCERMVDHAKLERLYEKLAEQK